MPRWRCRIQLQNVFDLPFGKLLKPLKSDLQMQESPSIEELETPLGASKSSRFFFLLLRYDLLVYVIRIEGKVDAFSSTSEESCFAHSAFALRVPKEKEGETRRRRPRGSIFVCRATASRPQATVARVEAMLPNLSTWNFLCCSTLRDNFSSFGWLPEVRKSAASDNNASILCVHKSLVFILHAQNH